MNSPLANYPKTVKSNNIVLEDITRERRVDDKLKYQPIGLVQMSYSEFAFTRRKLTENLLDDEDMHYGYKPKMRTYMLS